MGQLARQSKRVPRRCWTQGDRRAGTTSAPLIADVSLFGVEGLVGFLGAKGSIAALATRTIGEDATPKPAILFDKIASANLITIALPGRPKKVVHPPISTGG